jgi:beta-N-acetylhexosaminidase
MRKHDGFTFLLLIFLCSFSAACAHTPAPAENEAPVSSSASIPERGDDPIYTGSIGPFIPVEFIPGKSSEQRAQELLQTMTLDEKVGQMFLGHYPQANAEEYALAYQPGGYIMFAKDFYSKTPEDIQIELQNVQDTAKIAMLLGVDEEGGYVNRVSIWPQFRVTPFLSPQSLYLEGGLEQIGKDAVEKALLLKALGINLNLAPVCDVSMDSSDYIYSRTFGSDAAGTAEYVKTVVAAMKSENIGCVLKHFPGYGRNLDTHVGTAVDDRSYESFLNSDFIPFKAGIEEGAGAVLVSHSIVGCMDAQLPASLSVEVHRILREELGFDGVIITDDMNMKALRAYGGSEAIAVLAVQAGNDLICCPDFDQQIQAVIKAVENGTITESRINESVTRILAWKLELGIIA